jgi:hypothetical protein
MYRVITVLEFDGEEGRYIMEELEGNIKTKNLNRSPIQFQTDGNFYCTQKYVETNFEISVKHMRQQTIKRLLE